MLHLRKGQDVQIFCLCAVPASYSRCQVEATRACILSRTSYAVFIFHSNFGRISLVVTYMVTNYRKSYLGKHSQVQLGGRTEEGWRKLTQS